VYQQHVIFENPKNDSLTPGGSNCFRQKLHHFFSHRDKKYTVRAHTTKKYFTYRPLDILVSRRKRKES
jgi:hypothetical protein